MTSRERVIRLYNYNIGINIKKDSSFKILMDGWKADKTVYNNTLWVIGIFGTILLIAVSFGVYILIKEFSKRE
jgi:hypothetical protein